MGVIPFILEGQNKTIVESRSEFQNLGGVEGQVVLIQNVDRQQFTDTRDGNATYDLRVGEEFKDHRDRDKSRLRDGEILRLQARATVIIETEEYLYLPKSRFGHILPKVSLLHQGLSNTSSKIDPGYYGNLSITVFNLSNKEVTLKKGQKFCTLYMLDVNDGAIPYDKPPKQLPATPRSSAISRSRDFIENNGSYLTVLLTIVNLLVLLYQIFFN